MIMARTKSEERQLASGTKSPKKKFPVRYPLKFVERKHNRKNRKGRFQKKIQTADCGNKSTVKTDTGENKSPKIFSGAFFPTNRKNRNTTAPPISADITPQNRHCLRGLDGKYGKWEEILREIFNGKLRIAQNKKTETETKDKDDEIDEDDKEIPDQLGKSYDASE